MKLFKAVAAMACAVALSGAAQAATYSDSSANYELNHDLATGDNGGTGFGAWEIEKHGSGDGWAGCGVWDPSANNFQGDWAGKTQAFGIIGKGDSYGVNAYRPFRAPLAVGDSFSLEMAVNWDPNSGIDALKGFALLAKNGTYQALTINHRSNPGNIAINGNVDSEILNAFGTYPMKWTFTAKDATTLTVTATPRDGSETIYEQDWEVETSAIDGFRLQSSGQNPYEDAEAAEAQGETAQMWADRRQTYFDNFTLELADELPELVELKFSAGEWAVSSASQELSFALTRGSADGALDVTVKSSYEDFVPSTTVSFADGETEKEFKVTATLTGSGNEATLTALATGCTSDTYGIRGPTFRRSVQDDKYEFYSGEGAKFWVNWDDNGIEGVDLAKITVASDPEGAVTLPASLTWNTEDGGAYAEGSFTAVSSGLILFQYDGVTFADWGVQVAEEGFTLSGPASGKTGETAVYTLEGNFKAGLSDAYIAVSAGSVTPEYIDEVANGVTYDLTVTFPDEAGDVVLTVKDAGEVYTATKTIAVSAPVDPSIFDDYVAYDDASLYDDGFDFAATGAGQDKFQAWAVYKDSAEFGDAILTTADGGFPAILTSGQAFAIYANGDSPDYAIYRPFVNDLQPGQKASIEFVVPEQPGQALYVQFARVWDGYPYSRFEVWANNDGLGVNIDGAASESKALSWTKNARRIVASVERAADGSDYTLKLAGYNEGSEFPDDVYMHVVDANVGSWGEGIQGIAIGGYDLATDCIFNKLVIEQVEEPVVERKIGWGEGVWNPEGDGTYEITLTATTDDIGEVALSVEPAEGNTGTLELASETLDLTGATSGTISYTLTGIVAGDFFKISAVPADTTVAALEGEGAYGVGVIASYLSFWVEDGRYQFSTDDREIWIRLTASPSKYGTYTLVTSDDSVLELSTPTITINESSENLEAWFNVFIKSVGNATISLAEDETVNWGFEISQGTAPVDVEIPAPVYVKGKGLAWDASILDDGFVLRGTATLGDSPDKDSWSDLVEGTDYEIVEGQVVVLYSSAYNYIALLKK